MGGWWFNIQNPDIFQGEGKRKKYFEGWYYKIVHQSGDHAFALIPGISIESKKDKHAFIQLMDGTGGKSHYYEFPMEDFRASSKTLDIKIGENHFSKSGLKVNLPDLKGELVISGLTPLDKSVLNPGIMGWYSFTPFMQCYHGIVSMHHTVSGTLIHEGRNWDYNKGIGYIEKDWGSSFPKCWFWTQCNTFSQQEKISVFASVAHIPWMGSYFIGYIAAIQYGDALYRFATYNGSKYTAHLDGDSLYLEFKKGDLILKVKSTKGIGADLKSPISGKMTGKVNESLQATMEIELHKGEKMLLESDGKNGGLEIAGEFDVLLRSNF
ncbi:MAG: tocopherol cyclase family protein [Saprospiraceae bacterium]|nr:tocopherol cyclase family protein [Saprospiraceae bacterium]